MNTRAQSMALAPDAVGRGPRRSVIAVPALVTRPRGGRGYGFATSHHRPSRDGRKTSLAP